MGNDEKVNALVGKKITVKLMPLDKKFYSAAAVCGFLEHTSDSRYGVSSEDGSYLVFDLIDVDYVETTSIVVKY